MTYYINCRQGRYDDTCDEYDSRSEAYAKMLEYQIAEHGRAYYYLSTACKANWND